MNKTEPSPDIFPVLSYKDGRAAINWLGKAFGFESHLEVVGADGSVGHAELKYGSGMIMFASSSAPNAVNPWSMEKSGIYVVVSDIDAHYAKARAAGAQIVRELAETDYGAREYSARDPDGHHEEREFRIQALTRDGDWINITEYSDGIHGDLFDCLERYSKYGCVTNEFIKVK